MQDVFNTTLVPLGNIPNWFFIAFGFVLLGWWMKLQKEYNDDAANNSDQLK
jgi:hypothetical protein